MSGGRNLGPSSFAGSDRIKSSRTGNAVGFDSFTGGFDPETETVRVWAGIALRGGVLLGRVSFGDDSEFAGKITGGNGK